MPTYEYHCPKGHIFDVFQRMSDPVEAKCPECGAAAERKIVPGAGFLLKGEGFYITDTRSDDYKKKASIDNPGGDEWGDKKEGSATQVGSKESGGEEGGSKESGVKESGGKEGAAKESGVKEGGGKEGGGKEGGGKEGAAKESGAKGGSSEGSRRKPRSGGADR